MADAFEDAVREYIDLINAQVGVYMDALAGFEGHHTRVTRQVHRVLKATGVRKDTDGHTVIHTSYEDPTKPAVLHNRICRTDDYLRANAPGGSNEQQHAKAVLIFLFVFWEDEVRPRLAAAKDVAPNEIRSDVMGDLRVLRNVFLHAKGVLTAEKHKTLKVLKSMFAPDQVVHLSYDGMHQIFVRMKQDCARLMFEHLGIEPPVDPDHLRDFAIHRGRSGSGA